MHPKCPNNSFFYFPVTLSIVAALFALTGDSKSFPLLFVFAFKTETEPLNDRKVHCCYAKKKKHNLIGPLSNKIGKTLKSY